MGMAAVYGVIRSHDGVITVESDRAKGQRFVSIFLPLRQRKNQRQLNNRRPKLPWAKAPSWLLRMKSLWWNLFKQILERLGYRVFVAETGKEAVEFAKTFDGQIDLALLDHKIA